ncbi:hypothetical protein Cgig2_013172 [Carnegiea gigantea]|uniref:Fe2OG dioxygenase domain-containing protein n=1 Tax=Carnegiea gigantea TaxID=171969 RepID=A0A9Q1KPE8_9CARY|nr:hypothetical protein Cgig2_013172 [Carnegiea gigantea]
MNDGSEPLINNERRKELDEFDSTKLGVKGLVDSGITRIPRIFHHPPESLRAGSDQTEANNQTELIPVIDLSGPDLDLVDRVREASAKFGFFQVVNHGLPVSLLDRLIAAVKGFHELPAAEKRRLYRRGSSGVGFNSNFDLFWSKAASWRDTLEIRQEVLEWDKEVKQLGERLMGLLSQGLGLSTDRLKDAAYLGRRTMVGHYYPYCPEPNKTMGISSHTDPGVLTVLLQDQMGGLQVKHQGKWLDLRPLHGALVVNIGDMLQMISNDEYTSGEHRVLANPSSNARTSIAVFFSSGLNENWYGPLPELVSPEKPALYRQFKFSDLFTRFLSKEIEANTMTNFFRL